MKKFPPRKKGVKIRFDRVDDVSDTDGRTRIRPGFLLVILGLVLGIVFWIVASKGDKAMVAAGHISPKTNACEAVSSKTNKTCSVTNVIDSKAPHPIGQAKKKEASQEEVRCEKVVQDSVKENPLEGEMETSDLQEDAESGDRKARRTPKNPEDAWMNRAREFVKDQEPTLNILIDTSRNTWRNADEWSNALHRAFFTLSQKVYLQFAVELMGLSAKSLRNANALVLSRRGIAPYSPEEKELIDGFLKRGGSVLAIVGSDKSTCEKGCETVLDYLRGAGARFEYVPKISTGVAQYPTPRFRREFGEIEFLPANTQNYLIADEKGDWLPLVSDSIDGSRALVAMKKVGRGHLVFMSDSVVLGSDWSLDSKRINVGLVGRLVDALAESGRQVKRSDQFVETPLSDASCKLRPRKCGATVYASKRFEPGAKIFSKELDEFLPHIKEELGIVFTPPDSSDCFVAIGSGLGGHMWPSRRTAKDGESLYVYQVDVAPEGTGSPFERLFLDEAWSHGTFLLRFYDENVLDARFVFGHLSAFCSSLLNYQILRIMDRAGRKDFVNTYRLQCERQRDRENWFKVFDELTKMDKWAVRKFVRQVVRRDYNGDILEKLTVHQIAKTFAESIYSGNADKFAGSPQKAKDYVDQVFKDANFEVDWGLAGFKRITEGKDVSRLPWIWDYKEGYPRYRKMRDKRIQIAPGRRIDMIGCPAGRFRMAWPSEGSSGNEWNSHEVSITRPFWIGKTQITKGQWADVMGEVLHLTPVEKALGGRDSAKDGLTAGAVERFCKRLNTKYAVLIRPGYEFRPPTEAEWEYAFRAGKEHRWHGDMFSRLAKDDVQGVARLPEEEVEIMEAGGLSLRKGEELPMGRVGTKEPNEWGLYDMLGNGWEMVMDRFERPERGFDMANVDIFKMHVRYVDRARNPLARYKGVDGGFGLQRGGGFLYGKGFGKQLFDTACRTMPKDSTFRLVLGPKLDDQCALKDEFKNAILFALERFGKMAPSDMAKELGRSRVDVERMLKEMDKKDQLVCQEGESYMLRPIR